MGLKVKSRGRGQRKRTSIKLFEFFSSRTDHHGKEYRSGFLKPPWNQSRCASLLWQAFLEPYEEDVCLPEQWGRLHKGLTYNVIENSTGKRNHILKNPSSDVA